MGKNVNQNGQKNGNKPSKSRGQRKFERRRRVTAVLAIFLVVSMIAWTILPLIQVMGK